MGDCIANRRLVVGIERIAELRKKVPPKWLMPARITTPPHRWLPFESLVIISFLYSSRISLSRLVRVVNQRGDRQQRAEWLDPVFVAMGIDERHNPSLRRSNSAWVKYADALRRVSFARRTFRTSRPDRMSRLHSFQKLPVASNIVREPTDPFIQYSEFEVRTGHSQVSVARFSDDGVSGSPGALRINSPELGRTADQSRAADGAEENSATRRYSAAIAARESR